MLAIATGRLRRAPRIAGPHAGRQGRTCLVMRRPSWNAPLRIAQLVISEASRPSCRRLPLVSSLSLAWNRLRQRLRFQSPPKSRSPVTSALPLARAELKPGLCDASMWKSGAWLLLRSVQFPRKTGWSLEERTDTAESFRQFKRSGLRSGPSPPFRRGETINDEEDPSALPLGLHLD